MTDKVISLGSSTGGLAIIRALGKRGLHVVAMSHDPDDIGLTSKYASESVVCPHPNDQEAFLAFMLENAHRWPDALIIESGDYYAVALSQLKEQLSPHYRIITQDWDVLSQFMEKKYTYELAEAAGVPTPKTFYPACMKDIEALDGQLDFPCIIKPVRSHEFVAAFNTKLFVVHTFDELRRKFMQCIKAKQQVIIQEIVPGGDQAFERVHIYLNSREEPGVEIHHRAFRLSPPQYGVMRAGATVSPNEEARQLAYKLLDHLGYCQGVASFQFKRNEHTNELVLIEVNGRIPRSVQIDIASGVDMPWIIYQDIVHDVQLPPEPYHNTVWIEFWPDILNALVRDNGAFKLSEYVRPYLAGRRTFAILSLSDPKPFFKQIAMLPTIARRKLKERRQPSMHVEEKAVSLADSS